MMMITKGVEKLRRNRAWSQEGWSDFPAGRTQHRAGGESGAPLNLFGGRWFNNLAPVGCSSGSSRPRPSTAEPNRSDAAVGQGIALSSASEMRVTHARRYRPFLPSHNSLAAGRARFSLQSLPKISVSTARPCTRFAGRSFSGGTLKNPQTQPHHHSRRQGAGKDFQMGENAREEAPFPLTDVDRWVLSQTDEEFTYHTWDELRQLIRTTIQSPLLPSRFRH